MEDKKIRICLIDDDDTDRIAVKRMLDAADENYELLEATDVTSGRDQLANARCDVALVDYRLPDGTAGDLLRDARVAASTPVIILTGLNDRTVAKRMLRRGAQDYLVKGEFDANLLTRSIRYALERKHGEALRRQLMRADRLAAIGRLAAAAAHEVNNPATFVISNLEISKKRLAKLRQIAVPHLPDDVRAEALQLFDRIADLTDDNVGGVNRITRVVQDLGNFSRMETDEVEFVNVNEVLRDVERLAHNELRHRCEVELDLDTAVPSILAARGRLGQIFTNIIMNAAHAMEGRTVEENRIEISTTTGDDEIIITVSDTGTGIPAEQLESVFDPYFTTKATGEGTGLGLAVALELVQVHRGELDIDSTVGRGTTVTIRLPFDTGLVASAPIEGPTSSAEIRRPRRPRILLIDDERQLLHSLAEALEDDIDVVGAATGEAALQIAKLDDDFDAVICDVQIPDIDGLTVWEEVDAFNPQLASRFVFLTGGAITQRAKQFLAKTHLPVLEKPITPNQLHQFVEFSMEAPMVEG